MRSATLSCSHSAKKGLFLLASQHLTSLPFPQSVPENFIVVTLDENRSKHRYASAPLPSSTSVGIDYGQHSYPPYIFVLLFLIFAHAFRFPDWQTRPDAAKHRLILSILTSLVLILYRMWEAPCPRRERYLLPLHLLYVSRLAQGLAQAILGGDFAHPIVSASLFPLLQRFRFDLTHPQRSTRPSVFPRTSKSSCPAPKTALTFTSPASPTSNNFSPRMIRLLPSSSSKPKNAVSFPLRA